MGIKLNKRQRRQANKKTNHNTPLPKAKPLGIAGHITEQKTTAFVSKADCHTGHKLIFKTVEGIEVWAGGKSRDGGWHKMTPYPMLAIGPSETLGTWKMGEKTEVPEGWLCEQELTNITLPHMFSLDWPDFSIPSVSKEFWYAAIKDIRANNIKSISTQCAGGHGRTGVQLAILAYLLGTEEERAAWPDASALIQWVRSMHCTHAVEAKSQQEYIATVCGIPVGTNEIQGFSGVYTGGYTGGYTTTNYKATTPTITKNYNTYDDDLWYEQGASHLVTGRIIDQDGADYCPYCEIPNFIEFGSRCLECDEDPQMYGKVVPTCEVCDFDSLDNGICNHCDYDNSAKPSKVPCLCLSCGSSKSTDDFIMASEDTCTVCIAKSLSVKVSIKKGKTHILCGGCLTAKPVRHISRIDASKRCMKCYKCEADDMMKAGSLV
jgi:hypothetical protein